MIKRKKVSEERVIKDMVGRELTDHLASRKKHNFGEVTLEFKNLTVEYTLYKHRKVVNDVSMYVKKGEVVGISGIMRAGYTEHAMSICERIYRSNIVENFLFVEKKSNFNVKQVIEKKLAYITEDKKEIGQY